MQRLTCHVLYKDLAISTPSPFSTLESTIHKPTQPSITRLHAEPSMWPLQICLTGPGNAQSMCHLALLCLRPRLPSSLAQPYAVIEPPARDSQGFKNTRLRRRLYLPQYHRSSVPPYHRIRTLLNPSLDHIASYLTHPDSLPYPSTDLVARFFWTGHATPRCSLQPTPPVTTHTSPGTQHSP